MKKLARDPRRISTIRSHAETKDRLKEWKVKEGRADLSDEQAINYLLDDAQAANRLALLRNFAQAVSEFAYHGEQPHHKAVIKAADALVEALSE